MGPWDAVEAVEAPPPSNDWILRSWQTKDGLPQNTVYAILQTRDGYLWVGTGGGLARFDGVRFRTYGLQDGLRSIQISALAEDKHGVLWVGTRGGGLSKWEHGHFTTFTRDEGFPGAGVESLSTGKDGTLWIGTDRGLVKRSQGAFRRLGPGAGLPKRHVRAVLEDSKGVVWVSILQALYKGTNGSFARIEATASALNPVYSLCEDREGCVWAGGGNGHLWKLSGDSCERLEQTNGVPFQMIECMTQGKRGPLWIGTREGGLYSFSDGIFQKLSSSAGLSGHTIRALAVDRDGAVWAGTASEGLSRLSPKLLRVWGAVEGLHHREVTSVAEQRSGVLWATTQNGGVYRFQNGQFSRVKEPEVWGGYPNAYAILAASDGSIWATGESFLYHFQPDQSAKAYVEPPVGGEAIRAMCEGEQGVWLGTYYSTLLKADAAGVHVVMTNGSLGGDIRSMVREAPDTLWIGTSAGLYHWQRGALKVWTTRDGLASAMIQALYREADGTLWIGTLGGGLARMRDGRIFNITTRQGLADDVISQIVSDDFGYLWLGCNRGIMRLAREEIDDLAEGRTSFIHVLLLGQNEGMLEEQCASGHSPTAVKTKAGHLLFPTVDGIVEIEPREWLNSPAVIPQATIEEIRVNGQPQGPASDLVLAPGSRRLEVIYGAPSLHAADSLHFRFRLEPLEKNWVNAGLRRTAYYASLRPGRYLFRVAAGRNHSDWNEHSAVLGITVEPHAWETVWFQILATLAVCGAAISWYYHHIGRIEEKRVAQEVFTRQLLLSQESERKRVASELHDGLGQDLLLIKNRLGLLASDRKYSHEVGRELTAIAKDASRAIADVRTISHALRPSALEQVGLTKAIEWMAQQVAESCSTTRYSTQLQNIDGLLEPDMEINLYRIMQEALNNAMKHAQASQVIVETRREASGLWVSVFDNGRGFEPAQAGGDEAKPCFGLAGMRERARVLGGTIDFQSAPGNGTRLTVIVPLPEKRTGRA